MTEVHARAGVDSRAGFAEERFGSFCPIAQNVQLRPGVRVEAHVVVTGRTTRGAGCRVLPLACCGQCLEDLRYRGASIELVIAAGNQIREHVTMHPGPEDGGGLRRDRSIEQEAGARADLPAGR